MPEPELVYGPVCITCECGKIIDIESKKDRYTCMYCNRTYELDIENNKPILVGFMCRGCQNVFKEKDIIMISPGLPWENRCKACAKQYVEFLQGDIAGKEQQLDEKREELEFYKAQLGDVNEQVREDKED